MFGRFADVSELWSAVVLISSHLISSLPARVCRGVSQRWSVGLAISSFVLVRGLVVLEVRPCVEGWFGRDMAGWMQLENPHIPARYVWRV